MARPPTAGQMNQRVKLQKPHDIADGFGNFEQGFEDVATVSAQISETANGVGGAETVTAQKLTGTGFVTIVIRASSINRVIQPEWRIVNIRTNAIYNVRQIRNEDERGVWLNISAQYGVAT